MAFGKVKKVTEALRKLKTKAQWCQLQNSDTESDEFLYHVSKFHSALREIKVGSFVIFREGSLRAGRFGVGKVTYVARYGRSHLTVHRYGMGERDPSTNERIEGSYLPRYITKDGVQRLNLGEETYDAPDEVKVNRSNVLACGFAPDNEGYLPPSVRRAIELNVLLGLSWYADQLNRSLTEGAYMTCQSSTVMLVDQSIPATSIRIMDDSTLNTVYTIQEYNDWYHARYAG